MKIHNSVKLSSVLLAFMAILTLGVINVLNNSYYWVSHSHKVIEDTLVLRSSVMSCQDSVRGYIISHKVEFLVPYQDNVNGVFDRVDKLLNLVSDNDDQHHRIIKLKEVIYQKMSRIKINLTLAESNKFTEASDHISGGNGESLMRQVDSMVDSIISVEKELLSIRESQVEYNYKYASYGTPVLLIIAMFVVASAGKVNDDGV